MTELLTLILLYSLSDTSTLLNIFVVSFILYSWKETSQLSEGNSEKKEERNNVKKRKETLKETCEGNCQKKMRKGTL